MFTREMQRGLAGIWMALLWLLSVRCLGGQAATAVATVTAGFVTTITVTSGGSGYTSEPLVTITGGGGIGATAKSILSGDKVAGVVMLTVGSGYSGLPTVLIEDPPTPFSVQLRLVPELTIKGPAGSLSRVESAAHTTGPWTTLTNVIVGTEGSVVVDLSPGSTTRFYRAVQGGGAGPSGFVWIAPGSFVMGSTNESWLGAGEIQHVVTLTQGFWLSDHEVTQGEYQGVMAKNPSYFKADLNLPVEQVSWNDAVLFCQKLTERERLSGRIAAKQAYRLPTEAEWEYAARAGTTGPIYAEVLFDIAWVSGNSKNQTHLVKQKAPNAWGLYDMFGNVMEWCSDWYGAYPTGSVVDPAGPSSGSDRVLRGANWYNGDARAAARSLLRPDFGARQAGFRLVLSSVR